MGLLCLKVFPLCKAFITWSTCMSLAVHGAPLLACSTKFMHLLASGPKLVTSGQLRQALFWLLPSFTSSDMCLIPSKLGIAQCCRTFQSLHAHHLESSAFQDIWAAFLTLSASKKIPSECHHSQSRVTASHEHGSQSYLTTLVLSGQHSNMSVTLTCLGLASLCPIYVLRP